MPTLGGIEFHQPSMCRLVNRIDCQNPKRPADRGFGFGCRGQFHQAEEELHRMFAQPLALPGQPFVEIAVP
jgi:hypothetical protein